MKMFKIEASVWNMKDGDVIELQYNNDIFIRKQKRTVESFNAKVSYLEKWVRKNNFDSFTLDMFYKAYPKQVENKRLPRHISNLIVDGILVQMGKDRFKVNRVDNDE